MGSQEKELLDWINSIIETLDCNEVISIVPLREQASLRSYFRLETDIDTKVAVFSDPRTGINRIFNNLSSSLLRSEINVPKVEAFDHKRGFMIMEDFGDKVLQLEMNPENEKKFYESAIDQVHLIQKINPLHGLKRLTISALKDQMNLFEEWFLTGLLDYKCSSEEKRIILDAYESISKECANQPYVLCHFDFEFRNLMLLDDNKLGILDFQDLCIGPYALDLVSILKDIENPLKEEELLRYSKYFLKDITDQYEGYPFKEKLKQDIDYAGFQRQLRILGTLSRLHIRDKKSFRLLDLIQTLKFLTEYLIEYEEMIDFQNFLVEQVEPKLQEVLEAIE